MDKPEAMPQLFPQRELNVATLKRLRKEVESKLAFRNTSSKIFEPTTSPLPYPVLWYKQSSERGVFFISRSMKTVDLLYAYQTVTVQSRKHVAEAFMANFESATAGLMLPVFFEVVLPIFKFVVTDFVYSTKGHQQFELFYNMAFMRGYDIYAIDLEKNQVTPVNKVQFNELQSEYWGTEKHFQKKRFAIHKTR